MSSFIGFARFVVDPKLFMVIRTRQEYPKRMMMNFQRDLMKNYLGIVELCYFAIIVILILSDIETSIDMSLSCMV